MSTVTVGACYVKSGAGGGGGRSSFFFQAEAGIRDRVRSRGLGDGYKRQLQNIADDIVRLMLFIFNGFDVNSYVGTATNKFGPVSYTHLTLPTSDLV